MFNQRKNPDNRIQTLAQRYAITGDLVDAMDLANEYLRTENLTKPLIIYDMEVAGFDLNDIDWEQRDRHGQQLGENNFTQIIAWEWLNDHCCFRHVDEDHAAEIILFIKTDELDLTNRTLEGQEIPDEIFPAIFEAKRAGYAYICFYW